MSSPFFLALPSTHRFPCVPQYMAHVPFICSVMNSVFSTKENGLYSALAEDTQTSRHTITQLERLDPLARRRSALVALVSDMREGQE